MTRRRLLRDKVSRRELEQRQKATTAESTSRGWPAWATAVLSGLVALTVTLISGWFIPSSVYFGATEDRAKESREKRAQVYADYLDAARKYRDEYQANTKSCGAAEAADRKLGLNATTPPKLTPSERAQIEKEGTDAGRECTATGIRWRAASVLYTKQSDLVSVYGSDEAWAAHTEILRTVLVLDRPRSPSEPYDDSIKHPSDIFEENFGKFQKIFCREASPEPRSGCR